MPAELPFVALALGGALGEQIADNLLPRAERREIAERVKTTGNPFQLRPLQ